MGRVGGEGEGGLGRVGEVGVWGGGGVWLGLAVTTICTGPS